MKKSFIFATLATAALFAGCTSSDDLAGNPDNQGINPDELVAIQIGVGSPSSTMRGTGTVGGVSEYDESTTAYGTVVTPTYWAGQKINVYMLEHEKMTIAQFKDANNNLTDIYNNAVLITPTYTDNDPTSPGYDAVASGEARYIDTNPGTYNGKAYVKYYPPTDQYDFWGYRIDDATLEAGNPVVGTNDIKVSFTVDGTQDVLAASTIEDYTKLSAARQAAVEGADATAKAATFEAASRYSASAARKGIQPELLFKHMMTRLTFKVKAGTKSIATDMTTPAAPSVPTSPVYVTGISVRPVKEFSETDTTYVSTTGTLTVAYVPTAVPEKQMEWPEATTDEPALVLKKRPNVAAVGEKIENSNLVDIVDTTDPNYSSNGAINPTYTDDGSGPVFDQTPIGEAIIAPDAHAYEVSINLAQKLHQHEDTDDAADMIDMAFNTVKIVVRTDNTLNFLPGYSYNFLCTIYGLEKIEITATLEPWKQGEEIEIIGE